MIAARRARREDRQGLLRAAQGRRRRDARSGRSISATLEYRPKQSARIASIEAGKSIDDLRERVRMLFNAKDKAGEFLRETLAPTLVYTARVTPDIAHSIDDVDRVMRWGFGWELGPVRAVRRDRRARGAGRGRRRRRPRDGGRRAAARRKRCSTAGATASATGLVTPAAPDLQILRTRARNSSRVVKKNAGASLVDLGDGVLAVEFHSKMNAIGGDTDRRCCRPASRKPRKNGQALVVGNDAPNFSAGANLMLVLLEAQEGNWDELDLMIRAFQQATMALRYSAVPVVVGAGRADARRRHRDCAARRSRAGGRGNLHGPGRSRRRADPGRRRHQGDAGARDGAAADAAERSAAVRAEGVRDRRAREGLGERTRCACGSATSPPTDGFTMNRERLMADAKAKALERVREGYHMPAPRTAIPVGGESVTAALKLGVHLAWRAGRASDHDALIGRKLAHIFGGGDAAACDDGERAVPARSRARSVPEPARRAQDARADSAHAEDRQAAEELMMRSSIAERAHRSCSFPASRAAGSGCGRPSTRWRSTTA